jgi:hypothetical protein
MLLKITDAIEIFELGEQDSSFRQKFSKKGFRYLIDFDLGAASEFTCHGLFLLGDSICDRNQTSSGVKTPVLVNPEHRFRFPTPRIPQIRS